MLIFKRNADNHLGIKHGAKKPPRAGRVAAAAITVVVPVAFAFDDAVAVSDTFRLYTYIYMVFPRIWYFLLTGAVACVCH